MSSLASRLALGSAQFGLPYGVSNQSGQVGRDEVGAILTAASAAGVDTLDTAVSYGESEKRLGEAGVTQWKVVTKLPPLPMNTDDVEEWVQRIVTQSLQRLDLNKLYAVLLHHSRDLQKSGGAALFSAFTTLRNLGIIQKWGVSVYDPDELDDIWSEYRPELVQCPLNVIDQRFKTSGWLARLHAAGIEVHTRSAFLQGLLLMTPDARPVGFNRWSTIWKKWEEWLVERDIEPLHACLSFVLSQPQIDRVIVGVESLRQFQEILGSLADGSITPPAELMSDDRQLVNPSLWNLS